MINKRNKRGATLTNWVMTLAVVLLFVVILQTQVLNEMNTSFDRDLSTGLDTTGLSSLNSLTSSSDDVIGGAEVTTTADGLTLTSVWTVGKSVYKTLVDFIKGTFISHLLTDILDFPPIVANTLIVLIWISLIMIIIYIFMKVVP